MKDQSQHTAPPLPVEELLGVPSTTDNKTSKLQAQSRDGVSENLRRIAELFPNCMTERKGADGRLERTIDFDLLRQELSADLVEGPQERYQFNWPDKRNAIRLANSPITSTLRPCREESVDFDTTENLYIEGDNLDVLKLLQESYLGKVKMIYIDPPYNTGKDFVYEDNFNMGESRFAEASGQRDDEGNLLYSMKQNNESNGRYHTDWLNMIYPRLKVAKALLSDDGVIFISIDDNEVANLKKVCDEIFGEGNHIETLKWKRKKQPSFLAKHTARVVEYILVYSKNAIHLEKLSIEGTSDSTKKVINISNQESLRVFNEGVRVKIGENGIIPKGRYLVKTMEVEYLQDIYFENGRTISQVEVISKFSESQVNINKYIMEDLLYITAQYGLRRDVSDEDIGKRKSITDLLLDDWGDNQESDVEQKTIFGEKYFDYNKPTSLIKNLSKSNFTENSLILDFFSGSATTAHAVMQLNAEDGGKRKYICVQLPEVTKEDSEAHKAGYKNICEIGKERIRRAGKKIAETAEGVDIGFRVLKVDSSNMVNSFSTPQQTVQELFGAEESSLGENIKADRTPEDLLFQVMLELGVPLSSPIAVREIAGSKLFSVSDGYLMASFEEAVSEAMIEAVAKEKPYYFVLRDSSLASDAMATNFEQIFKTYSPDTVRRIL